MSSTTIGSRAKVNILLFGRVCIKQTTTFLDLFPMAKKIFFSGLGEALRTPWATSQPLDHGSTCYFRGRHEHLLALPDTKRVDRGLILCRDRKSIVAELFLISVLRIFNVKAQVAPRAAA